MQPKMVDLCVSFSMAQGDLTRAFSRRSKKEKEREEREREHAVPRAGRRSVRVEGNARGGGGAAQDGIPRRAGGASDGGERESTPIHFFQSISKKYTSLIQIQTHQSSFHVQI